MKEDGCKLQQNLLAFASISAGDSGLTPLRSQEFKLCHEKRSGEEGAGEEGGRDRKLTTSPKLSGCKVRPSEAENSLTLIVFGLLAAAALTTGKN